MARHEGALQERFAMSRSTRDLWARFKIVMAAVSDFTFLLFLSVFVFFFFVFYSLNIKETSKEASQKAKNI